MPELRAPLTPEYPPSGTKDARVVLRVTLDREGHVTRVAVDRGDEPFASAAISAVERAQFSPALRAGQPVAATITVAVDFTFSAPEPSREAPPAPASAAPTQAESKSPPSTEGEPAEPQTIDVVVSAPRVDDTERSIYKAEARLTAGTFGDPLRAIELLPGITPLISGAPYFFVRGAPAGSVNFYIDEARVPQLYHAGPGSSVLHPQFVEAVALRSGPYRARYGDATSGIITVRANTGVTEFAAEAETKVFESAAYVGAPTPDGQGMVAVAGKRSHLGPVLALVNPDLRLEYWDYQLLSSYNFSPRDQVTLLFFGAGDLVGEKQDSGFDINLESAFYRLKFGYNRNLDRGVDLHNYVILGADASRFAAEDEAFAARSIGVGSVLSFVPNNTWEWAAGASADATDFDASEASFYIGDSNNAAVSRVDTQSAVWAEGRVSPTQRVKLDAGLRFAHYSSAQAQAISVEPRLSSTLEMSERLRAILAVGYSTQTPSAGVPLPGVRPAELRGGLQHALQRALTLRYAIPFELTSEATLFYNDYFKLSDPLSLSTIPDPLEVGDATDGSEPILEDLNFDDRPRGRAAGLELLLRRPFTKALSGSLGYTLSRAIRRIGAVEVPSSFDRTHVVQSTAGYDFGAGYNLSARLLVYSGLPVREVGVTGGRTGNRSEPFTRIDVRFSKEWSLSWSRLMLIVEMLNATFQEEILGVSCLPDRCITAKFGPVSVPSVGLRGTFGGAITDRGGRAQFK